MMMLVLVLALVLLVLVLLFFLASSSRQNNPPCCLFALAAPRPALFYFLSPPLAFHGRSSFCCVDIDMYRYVCGLYYPAQRRLVLQGTHKNNAGKDVIGYAEREGRRFCWRADRVDAGVNCWS
jgi:hypothetical protein